jgi:hypothetical protein
MDVYLFPFFGVLEVFDVLYDVAELFCLISFREWLSIFWLSQRRVIHVDLLCGNHQILIVSELCRVTHLTIKYSQIIQYNPHIPSNNLFNTAIKVPPFL